ncbi:uncharacterized protein C18orf63-like [Carassius carassius]|uniref:uncharacterized protein C18orf63-like n=1 Tax=Carassius carassius TaxID=217509 RepID=UPI00286912C5|nr:uncharacterized protein C18orf63-like [Carassius carassius]XP_059380247.1 uncharacterized protein C18orf63-like [Carassius carassius]
MSGSGTQSLLFLNLPDLRNLCCVNLFFSNSYDETDLRNKQVKTCRELVLLHSDIVASPVLGHFGGITVIMTIAFYKSGIIQAFAQKHGLQLNPSQRVFPAILQTCLSYSVTARLAPKWNKAGQYLIAGKDFLSDSGKHNAVVLELSLTETQLCVNVEANTVRLPPAVIKDFDIPAPVVKNFLHSNDAVLDIVMTNNWCHVLPSMKKGQIISISRRIPQQSPFQSYMEFQTHWGNMYGYQLPSVSEEEVVYCSVYFKPIGDKLFTYPLCCIRTQPVQCFPRVDLQGVLGNFISDLQAALESVCGLSVQMTCKPCYYSYELTRPDPQRFGSLPANVTTENSSRAVLNQLPSSWPRDAAQQRSSHCDSTGKQTQMEKKSSLDSSVGQKDWTSSNLATQRSSSHTNVHFTHIQSQSALPRPKLVPVFRNRSHSRHVNVTEMCAVKQQQGPDGPKLTAVIRPLSSTCLSSSSKPHCSTPPASSNQFSRPPASERMTLPFSKSKVKTNNAIIPTLSLVQMQPHIMPEIPSNRGGDTFESKPKRLKQSGQDVEVYATSNQLSKISSATLQAWLKSRGISVRSKDKKEELVSKVMKCLSET